MLIALRLDESRQLCPVLAERLMSFLGQNQPVVPVPNLILQFLKRLADYARFLVVAACFRHVPCLLRALAKIVKIALVQPLHLVGKTRKFFKRYHRRTALSSATAHYPDCLVKGRHLDLQPCAPLGRRLHQWLSMVLARMFQPCIQIPRLIRDWVCCHRRLVGGRRSLVTHLLGRHHRRVLGCNLPAAILLLQPLLLQQLSMHIKIPHCARRTPYLFKQLQPPLRRAIKSRRLSESNSGPSTLRSRNRLSSIASIRRVPVRVS